MAQIFTPDGMWPRYQIRIGYETTMHRDRKLIAAFNIQAAGDGAAESIGRRLADALCPSSNWGPCYEVERLP